jgi:hypothetical protein
MNPNSSSLGVDVTFLLFGAAAVAMTTPLVGAWLRWRKPAMAAAMPAIDGSPGVTDESAEATADANGATFDRTAR